MSKVNPDYAVVEAHAATAATFRAIIPPGLAGGDFFAASAPDGRQVHVFVPAGSVAGSSIDVPLPPAHQAAAPAGAVVRGWVADTNPSPLPVGTSTSVNNADGSVSIDLPPGPVGIALVGGTTIVHSVEPTSPLRGLLDVGDRIVAFKQPNTQASVDTTQMTDEQLVNLLAACSAEPGRRITLVRGAPAATPVPGSASVGNLVAAASDERAVPPPFTLSDGTVSIELPPGPLGIVLTVGSTQVHSMHPTSPLLGRVNAGDRIIAYSDASLAHVNTSRMTDVQLGDLFAAASAQPGRRITLRTAMYASAEMTAEMNANTRCMNTTSTVFLVVQGIFTLLWVVIAHSWPTSDQINIHLIHIGCMAIYGCLFAGYRHAQNPGNNMTADQNSCWRCVLIGFGIIFTLICMCCCFDADSTVWRLKLDDRTMEEVALRDLTIGDSVLSLNPVTRETYWEEVMAKVHYSAFDGGRQFSSMRTLVLASNASITLSHTHFIFAQAGGDDAAQELVRARDVQVGDWLLHHDVSTGETAAEPVVSIEPDVRRQKRSFFLTSPYVLVNNISASPYMGAHPAIAPLQHFFYAATVRNAPGFTQAWVTTFSIPFLVLNNFVQVAMQAVSL